MGSPKEYNPEPLVEAVTALDWSVEHGKLAMKAIQETVLKMTGDDLSDTDAVKVLGRLIDRKLIRSRVDSVTAGRSPNGRIAPRRKARYVRVPEK
jgi:hypothetical protein